MNNFLLIANAGDDNEGKPLDAIEIARARLNLKLWGLYENTPHRKTVQQGDKVIIYIAGTGKFGKHFVATAQVGMVLNDKKLFMTLVNSYNPPFSALQLVNIAWFNDPLPIISVKTALDFIPQNTSKWGCVLQRGVKKISQKDFETILDNIYFANLFT